MSTRDGQRRRRNAARSARPSAPAPASEQAARPARRRPAWRAKMDPYGGLTTILVIVGVLAFLGAVAWQARPRSVSSEDLRGEAVAIASASHTTNPADLIIPEGEPPAGGPHYPVPLKAGVYDEPVQDGNAIHSLEHGMIWISYDPEQASPADIEKLKDIQDDHGRDVILSPRPENTRRVDVVSWGRILRLDGVDEAAIEDFIRVNRDRSPEPGVR